MTQRTLSAFILSLIVLAASTARAQTTLVEFRGTQLVTDNGYLQWALVPGGGYISDDRSMELQSGVTYPILTTWNSVLGQHVYGEVTVDSTGVVTDVTGALTLEAFNVVGFDRSLLNAVHYKVSELSRGFQVSALGGFGRLWDDDTIYLPDGTYGAFTDWVPGHHLFGTFTLSGGGVTATSGALEARGGLTVGYDLSQLAEVVFRGDLLTTSSGGRILVNVPGVAQLNRYAPASIGVASLYLPDATYRMTSVANGSQYGTFTVSSGALDSTTDTLVINGGGELEVDQAQLNQVEVTPLANRADWVIGHTTFDYEVGDGAVPLLDGSYVLYVRYNGQRFGYPFTVVDGVFVLDDNTETGTLYLPAADPLVKLSTDSDGDGIPDADDACPNSDLSETVVIDGHDSGVANQLFADGCTMSDLIAFEADVASNHGEFVSAVAHLTNEWKREGLITGKEKGAIQKCAAKAFK